MEMPEVYLTGELRMKNYEIFRINHTKDDGWNYSIGFLVIEDCNRKTEIYDYPYLLDVYENHDEFEGGDNVIKVKAIVTEPLDESDAEIIERIGIGLVEFKEHVDCLFSIEVKPDLEEWIDLINEKPFVVYNELLKFTENKPNIENYSKEKLKRLYQE
mgnify:CR=1 FL=1